MHAASNFLEDWENGKLDPTAEDFNQGNGAAPAADADADASADDATAAAPSQEVRLSRSHLASSCNDEVSLRRLLRSDFCISHVEDGHPVLRMSGYRVMVDQSLSGPSAVHLLSGCAVLFQAVTSPAAAAAPSAAAAAAADPQTPRSAKKVAPEVSWQPARLASDLGLARWGAPPLEGATLD